MAVGVDVKSCLLIALVSLACSNDASKAAPIDPPLAAPPQVPVARPDKEPPRPAALQRVTLKALGMYCEDSCPTKVRAALAGHPEIYELGFDVSNEAIFISYDASLGPPKQVTKSMLTAIKGVGFDPWLSKEEWPADATAQVVLRPDR